MKTSGPAHHDSCGAGPADARAETVDGVALSLDMSVNSSRRLTNHVASDDRCCWTAGQIPPTLGASDVLLVPLTQRVDAHVELDDTGGQYCPQTNLRRREREGQMNVNEPPSSEVSTASLTDALGRVTSSKMHVLDLVSPTPGRVLRGRAATIRYVPFREDVFDAESNSMARFFYEAIPTDPEGTVLVLESSGCRTVSMGGGTKLSRLQNWNLAGLITDGRLRDFAELARYKPVIYCGGETVKAGTAAIMPIAANVPVVIGGVTVLPGDYLYADSAGAVCIPSSLVDVVFRLAEEIDSDDLAAAARIRNEDREGRRAREYHEL